MALKCCEAYLTSYNAVYLDIINFFKVYFSYIMHRKSERKDYEKDIPAKAQKKEKNARLPEKDEHHCRTGYYQKKTSAAP